MAQEIVILIDPVGAPRMTQRDKWTDVERGKGRPAVLKYFKYRDDLKMLLPAFKLDNVLTIDFYIPFPKSYSRSKQTALYGTYHDQKPDSDNLAKAFMDSFKDVDDKRVADLHVRKFWAFDGCIVINPMRP